MSAEEKALTAEEKRRLGIEEMAALAAGIVFDHLDPRVVAVVTGIVLSHRIDPKDSGWYRDAQRRIDDLILLAAEEPRFRDEPTIGGTVRRLAAAVRASREAQS